MIADKRERLHEASLNSPWYRLFSGLLVSLGLVAIVAQRWSEASEEGARR